MAAGVLAAGSLFLPWARSGQALRTGFSLARTVDVLGLADRGPMRLLLVGVWCSPLLAALAWTAAAIDLRRVAGVFLILLGVLVPIGAVLVLRSDLVKPVLGPWIGILAGIGALAGGIWLAGWSRSTHGAQRR